jgi:hypothetical protein
MGAESRLINFCDGSGDPSTQPFHPFFIAGRGFRGRGGCGEVLLITPRSSSSSGVRGLFEEVREVLEDMEGPGVEAGDKGMGGGVTETERCMVAMWMVGRALQKDDAPAGNRIDGMVSFVVVDVTDVAFAASSAAAFSRAAFFSLFFSLSISLFSCFLFFLALASSSTVLYGPTPLSKLVNASLAGRESKSPARTAVAVRRCRLSGGI